jgi:hypothetical protein
MENRVEKNLSLKVHFLSDAHDIILWLSPSVLLVFYVETVYTFVLLFLCYRIRCVYFHIEFLPFYLMPTV